MDTNQQNTTLSKVEVVSGETGLTPTQEKTALLLASGQNIKAVAECVKVNRSTIYSWLKYAPFVCFYNRQCADNKNTLMAGLCGLADEALQTIKSCLHSANEATRLKTAIWLTERIFNTQIGEADIRTVIEKECTGDAWGALPETFFNESKYKKRLSELCLDIEPKNEA